MKRLKFLFCICLLFIFVSPAFSAEGIAATEENIRHLKRDLRDGNVKVGITRLKTVNEIYGMPGSISDSQRKVTYDYGDLKIEFNKQKFLKDWTYDYSNEPGYSDDIDDLRDDLESKEIIGDNWTFKQIRKDYGEPTKSMEKNKDGELSIYYYGEIKLTFENIYTVQSWKGKDLMVTQDEGVLGSSE